MSSGSAAEGAAPAGATPDTVHVGYAQTNLVGPAGYDMKSVLTIRLDADLERRLSRLAKQTGRSRNDLARDALRRQFALLQFEQLRRRVLPFAEARGYLTDEDVSRDVS